MANLKTIIDATKSRHPERNTKKMDDTKAVAPALGDKHPTQPSQHVRADTMKPLTYKKEVNETGSLDKSVEVLRKPFKSEAQRRYFHWAASKHKDGITPEMAHEWESATPKDKKLPEKLDKDSSESLKAQHRLPKEPSLGAKIKEIKAKFGEKKSPTFDQQVNSIKAKYTPLLTKARERLQKGSAVPSVSVIGVMDNGHLLMGRRRDNNKWTFPGGHGESGESPEQAARRELKEETGLDAEFLHHVGSKVARGHDGTIRHIHVYICRAPHRLADSGADPDEEVHEWKSVPAINGRLPPAIENELHVPSDHNVLLQYLRESK